MLRAKWHVAFLPSPVKHTPCSLQPFANRSYCWTKPAPCCRRLCLHRPNPESLYSFISPRLHSILPLPATSHNSAYAHLGFSSLLRIHCSSGSSGFPVCHRSMKIMTGKNFEKSAKFIQPTLNRINYTKISDTNHSWFSLIYLQAPSEGDVTTFLCIQSTSIEISLYILISFNWSTQK